MQKEQNLNHDVFSPLSLGEGTGVRLQSYNIIKNDKDQTT